MTYDIELKSGVRLVAETIPSVRSVCIGIWVRAGVTTEAPEQNGLSHFLEHMLFKGTQKRSAKQIAVDMDNIGGQLNAFTAKECTCYYAKAMDEKLPEAVEILCDMFCNSVFAEQEIEKEKGVVLEEIAMSGDTPDDVAHETVCSGYFATTPIEKPVLGPAENIRALSRQNLVDYVDARYTAGNVVVAVAGSFEITQLVKLLEQHLAGVPKGNAGPIPFDYAGWQPERKFTCIDKEIEQVHVSLGLPGYHFTDPRKYALSILCNLLGGSMSSHLFQTIREEFGLAYSVFSYASVYMGAGMLALYAGTSQENASKVVRLMQEEFSNLRKHYITAEELAQGKVQLRGNFVLSQESTSSRMNALGKSALLSGRILSDEEVLARLDGVTLEEVRETIDHVFDESRMCGVCVGRPDKLDEIREMLG